MHRPRTAQRHLALVSGLALVACGTPEPKPGPGPGPKPKPAPVERPTDFVEITTIPLDIRYATANNFTNEVVYTVAKCKLRRPVAEALLQVQADLAKQQLSLKLWDCYRPISVQQTFWSLVPDERYVAKPVWRDGAWVEGSKHNRGAAVDLTLIDADGNELPMPTDYDDFTPAAHRDSTAGTPEQRANAKRLEDAMTARGFEPLPTEWWHFDGPGWKTYDLADEPL